MRALRTIQLRLRSLFRGHRVAQEVDAELRDHLERLIEFHRAAGLSPADARDAALREFGNVPLIQERCRDMRRVNWIEDLRRDVGYAPAICPPVAQRVSTRSSHSVPNDERARDPVVPSRAAIAYNRGRACQSEESIKAWYSADEIDRLEYWHAMTNVFFS